MNNFIGALLFTLFVLPHGDLDQRILEKSNQIALHPLDHQLYMERGELYLLHEEYLNAKGDFSFCLDHEFVNTRVLLGMSKSLLYLNSLDSALLFVENTLALEEDHLSALELKGMILSRLERYCDAAGTMERLLSLASQPSPILFLEASKDWASCNETSNSAKAIHVLKDGINRIGSVGVLQKQLVSIYKRLGRYDEAIQMQTSIIEQSDLKIRPYFERAQLYIKIQSNEKAKEDLIMAMSLMDNLPAYKKNIPSMKRMKNEMTSLLNELEN